ncbi:caspase family protein [Massilimicrobiota timonensis]|uniref:caspase family protein n=1 Tax=Massilimicrobiota timonensis TaxID=1776392 RepID=UPI00101BBF26|nr:caspase family protein [Massilimicrobiota timonensis]
MKKALVVGLNNYPGCELEWCDNDAIAIKELIESNGDGSPNFDVISIINSCSQADLNIAIQKLFADDANIALLYFSGHGYGEGGGYLCTTDFSEANYGVRMTDVLMYANNSKCKNKVIILDCCFAAKMGESLLLNNSSVLGAGVTIIAASQPWQTSSENGSIQHGVFTDLLIQALKGGAADISGNITPASLYSFVDQSLGAWQQRPVFKTNISQFLPIRTVNAKVPRCILRKLSLYFENATDEFKLDPSFEYTNTPSIEHKVIEPYANQKNVDKFKELQLFESVGLVEPVGTEHMYFAAMESKACKLTALGLHYWRLSKDKRF